MLLEVYTYFRNINMDCGYVRFLIINNTLSKRIFFINDLEESIKKFSILESEKGKKYVNEMIRRKTK